MMQWFRMWTDAIDDEKLKLLAFEDRWHYVALLCMKRTGLLDEAPSDLKTQKLCVKMGLDRLELETVMKRLVTVGLINESFQPLGWKRRQFESDSSTSRVRKFRKRQRNKEETFQKRPQTQISDSDSDTEKNSPLRGAPVRRARTRSHVDDVFEHWRQEHGHQNAKLDEKRKRRIVEGLKTFTAEQLRNAVSGYRHSPHHMGTDPRGNGVRYDDIELFLRDTKHIEAGLRLFAHPPRPPPNAETAHDRMAKMLGGIDENSVIEHERELAVLPSR